MGLGLGDGLGAGVGVVLVLILFETPLHPAIKKVMAIKTVIP